MDADHPGSVQSFIEGILDARGFGVLATHSGGQPHASLITITPLLGLRHLVCATYRDSQKFGNLSSDSRVAVLIDGRGMDGPRRAESGVLTAQGRAGEISGAEQPIALDALLRRHPDLEAFARSDDCALVCVTVDTHQCVRAIDDVLWWPLGLPTGT